MCNGLQLTVSELHTSHSRGRGRSSRTPDCCVEHTETLERASTGRTHTHTHTHVYKQTCTRTHTRTYTNRNTQTHTHSAVARVLAQVQYPLPYLVPHRQEDVLAAHGVQVHLGKDAAVVGGLPDDAETLGLEPAVHRQLVRQTDTLGLPACFHLELM